MGLQEQLTAHSAPRAPPNSASSTAKGSGAPPSPERDTRCSANGCIGSRHGNACRWYSTTDVDGLIEPRAWLTAACAIVPAYPNELTPPSITTAALSSSPPFRGRCSKLVPTNAAPTCGLSTRSCAFGATIPFPSSTASLSAPASPAPGSVCPAFAFKLPIATGRPPRPPLASHKTAATAPASIGSPSAVPVPCASSTAALSAASNRASPHAAESTPRCACPLGAVKLALLPSCRTALPAVATAPSPSRWQATASIASPRA
eukprot:1155072-Prymnesium_polylepis.2